MVIPRNSRKNGKTRTSSSESPPVSPRRHERLPERPRPQKATTQVPSANVVNRHNASTPRSGQCDRHKLRNRPAIKPLLSGGVPPRQSSHQQLGKLGRYLRPQRPYTDCDPKRDFVTLHVIPFRPRQAPKHNDGVKHRAHPAESRPQPPLPDRNNQRHRASHQKRVKEN